MLYSHPEKPLKHHLEEVEFAAMAILGRHPRQPFAALGIDVAQTMRQLAGWHDIAKATVFFQQYICDTDGWQKKVARNAASNEQKTRTPLGALLAADDFRTQQPWYLPLLITMAIRGHHNRLPTIAALCNSLDSQRELLAEQSRNLSPDVTSAHPSLEDSLNRLTNDGFDAVYRKVMRLTHRDWPEQLEEGTLDQLVRIRLAVQFCFSCLLEADKALLIHPTVADYFGVPTHTYPATLVEDQLPPGDTTTAINQQRRSAYQIVIDDANSDGNDYRPRVLTLPTGLGKTRCAAGWAIHWRFRIERETGIRPKIIVVLPFLSVIEQTAKVYRELLGLEDHSNAGHLQTSHSLSLRDHMDVETESLEGNAKDVALGQTEFMLDTWRSEVVLTTFDQFLLALMDAKSRHQQRFHNLCDALIVIDEVQAFPVHLWHPVGTLLTELAAAGRSRLLLMTATQPGIMPPSARKDLVDQPRRYAQPRYQMEIDLSEQPLSQWLDGIANEITSKPEVKKWLLVFNTRRCAQDVYRSLKEATSDLPHELMLLSSDIVPRDRLARIDRIKASDTCIAVTTQCVEAGVDIDMDRVIRDFAPLDSLVQVAGRCNRNGKRERQTVRVVRLLNELPDGTVHKAFGDYIYDKVALSTSVELLRLTPIVNEEDVTDLVERYFAELAKKRDSGSELTKKWARFDHDDINIQRELRGDNNRQVSFVVEKLDPSLRVEIVAAYDEKDRWKRRRRLRDLGPRIAQVTVNPWLNKSFRPEDV
ncbi:MAG: CRISPR-associated helicase Cas3', partial [Planctomycetota bacterium]|nr:CRISPR-associated helicase Cas3' [Planctomycetota bacterium]